MRREYTLAQLADAVGMTERNVRAYRSRGLIRPPRRRGRTGYYGFDHLTQLRLVQALTGRGLSLSVVQQLIRRGMAQNELARMIRDDMPTGPAVDLSSVVVHEVEQRQPGLLDALVAHGLGRRTPDGFEADPNLLALANQLADVGVDGLDIARVCLAGAEAAESASALVEAVGRSPRQPGSRSDDEGPEGAVAGAVELATTAFRLALDSRLRREVRGPGPATGAGPRDDAGAVGLSRPGR